MHRYRYYQRAVILLSALLVGCGQSMAEVPRASTVSAPHTSTSTVTATVTVALAAPTPSTTAVSVHATPSVERAHAGREYAALTLLEHAGVSKQLT